MNSCLLMQTRACAGMAWMSGDDTRAQSLVAEAGAHEQGWTAAICLRLHRELFGGC